LSEKLIVRTSDRQTFRKCRQLWDFRSKVRQAWDYVPGITPLDFGIAIHKGMEIYYDPARWDDYRDIVEAETIVAYLEVMDDWKKRLREANQWDLMRSEFEEHRALGQDMFNHYFTWAPKQNERDGWVPLKAEIEFEVPIPVPSGFGLPEGFVSIDGNLHKVIPRIGAPIYIPIVYQGRVDLIVYDELTGKYIIVDFKSAAQFADTQHWDTDTQVGSYCWAIKQQLNIDTQGFVIEELRKKAPSLPNVLKKGGLSKNKNQSTTYEMYKQAIRDGGHNEADYEDILDYFKHNQQEYFRRISVNRNPGEMERMGILILMEAIDMFNDPFIYPHANRWNCSGCAFYTPCLLKLEGSDEQDYLKRSVMYEKIVEPATEEDPEPSTP
jgi:hypothetical protein